ncbi:SARP family transcriptional regulator, partial [Streptomyces sp. SID3343]|nr:SARP family transcriptional regulator [Streptomyces sp. SID3343]
DDVPGRLEAVMGMVRGLAVTGDLAGARHHRARAIADAERWDDPELTARVITAFDVPAVWTRNDDEELARQVVAATERTLAALPTDGTALRSRLLTTLALESRGTTTDVGRRAAAEAEAIARRLEDPALLAFALNGRFMHAFGRPGSMRERATIGAELVELATAEGLVTFEVLGHLILVQTHAARAEFTAADAHADAADRLADRHEIPLVGVFTRWYAALRLAAAERDRPDAAEAAYGSAAADLDRAGMPGLAGGLLPLALLALRIARDEPIDADAWAETDWGPHEPWVRPLLLAAAGRGAEAAVAAAAVPESPHDLLREARLCLSARTALALGDDAATARAYRELLPLADELVGAGSGLLSFGPVAGHLADLATALGRPAEATEHRRQEREIATRAAEAGPA